MGKRNRQNLADQLSVVCLGIMALLPFHAFFTTWAGSNFGHLDLWRIWKELVIFVIVWPILYLALRSKLLRRWLATDLLPRFILLYVFIYVLLGVIADWRGTANSSAIIYALFSDLRYMVFFLMMAVLAALSSLPVRYILRVLVGSAIGVISVGLLQIFVLPYDTLKHFGYGPNTIPAYQTVDNKLDYQRIQATLRGANPLGAYLAYIAAVIAGLWPLRHGWRLRLAHLGLGTGLLVCLLFSYSRSGYLGAMLAVGVLVLLRATAVWRKRLIIVGAVCLMIGGASVAAMRHQPVVQNTLFHSDNSSRSGMSSNAGRAAALQSGLRDVLYDPVGRGPGTAGPASVRNTKYSARIAENYFLQLGQEVGWLGLALFLVIQLLVAKRLWARRGQLLGQIALASFVGLTVINLVSHAWADDTLGLLWWGFAGVVIGSGIPDLRKINHSQVASDKSKTILSAGGVPVRTSSKEKRFFGGQIWPGGGRGLRRSGILHTKGKTKS